jgi:hypothetical protein
MACRVAASKRISLNNDNDMLEVGENLKDVVSFHEFKQSLTPGLHSSSAGGGTSP